MKQGSFHPHHKSIAEGDRAIEEERRLFYVGITRARERLTLTSAGSRSAAGSSRPRLPSRFLSEIQDRGLFEIQPYDPNAKASEESRQFYLDLYKKGIGKN
ncbi:MAG: ATP-dependent helicase [Planctomycetes bacterium]|nr:ATP-dependent helicase [Planctomycetota bacterium]